MYQAEFLPCLEKHGKVCEMLLSPEEVHLIQSVSEADGMHITARWAVVSRFYFPNEQLDGMNSPSKKRDAPVRISPNTILHNVAGPHGCSKWLNICMQKAVWYRMTSKSKVCLEHLQ